MSMVVYVAADELRAVPTLGEPTEVGQLLVIPLVHGDGRFAGLWGLLHEPSGYCLLGGAGWHPYTPQELREIATGLASWPAPIDWTLADVVSLMAQTALQEAVTNLARKVAHVPTVPLVPGLRAPGTGQLSNLAEHQAQTLGGWGT